MEDNSTVVFGSIRLTSEENFYNNTPAPPSYGYINYTTPFLGQSTDDLLIPIADVNRDPFYVVIPITVIYAIIFITGIIGNISTCIVISRNKSMHTATNYYLFSLAISDFILLMSGVPMELYYIWQKHEFIFGEAFCILRNAINEMSANATVLTITAFTIERYVAICHPFLSHTMSKLSRAIKFIFLIWILSIAFATPQAMQTGIVVNEQNETWCTVVQDRVIIEHSFLYATILFFFAPMMLISVLYLLIGIKLRSNTLIKRENGNVVRNNNLHSSTQSNTSQSTKRVIKMLVAVVICFILCWLPFHFQRLVYIYMSYSGDFNNEIIISFFTYTTYISGVLYYVSTCINPILYNLMSNKFRNAFKETLQKKCCQCSTAQANYQKRQYRILSRGKRWNVQSEPSEYSGSGKDDYYSSSTQKQSIETIATSRNTSCKQLNKYYTEHFGKTLPIIEMGSSATSRFPNAINENEEMTKNCNTCLSTKIVGSEINLFPDYYINEIQLNIFPPSALYTTRTASSIQGKNRINNQCDGAGGGGGISPVRTLNCLSIDVHENKLHTLLNDVCGESKDDAVGNFSHISFKKRDSILHISIGNSSKIMKRSKHKRRWFFARFYKMSRKSKKEKEKNQMFLNSQFGSRDGNINENNSTYNLDHTESLNIVNDNLVITINKKSHENHHENPIDNNQLRRFERDLDYGANELDFYMNEIKRRENRGGYEV